MRFFSNEAKETDDDPEVGEDNRAQADGAPVPQQRSGSPWSDTPGTVSDTTDVNGTDPLRNESLKTDDSEVRHDGDDLVRDDDAPRSDDHDDLDLPLDGRTTETDEYQAGSHRADNDADTTDSPSDTTDSPSDTTSEAGAEQLNGTTTTYGPDGSVTTVDEPADTEADTDGEKDAEPVAADTVDRTDEERDLDEAAPADATAPVDATTTDDSTADDTTPADPTVDSAPVDSAPVDSAPVDSTVVDSTPVEDTATDADAAPAVAAVPAGAADTATTTEAVKPDPTANPVGDKLFTDGDSFNERLRDITFNFVDDPQEATQQAAALVDEAIDKVTSALKAQKDALASDGDDTEKLRVELRGYRDILKRLTAL